MINKSQKLANSPLKTKAQLTAAHTPCMVRPVGAIVLTGFDTPKLQGGRNKPAFFDGVAFFVSAVGHQLVSRWSGGVKPASMPWSWCINLIVGSPFLFDTNTASLNQGGSL